jgi:methyl-accepting chemotaxis protein
MKFGDWKVQRKLSVLVGVGILGLVVFGLLSVGALQRVQVGGPLYRTVVAGKDLTADVLPPPAYLVETYLCVLWLQDEADPAARQALVDRCRSLASDFRARSDYWQKTLPAGELRDKFEASAVPARRFLETMEKEYLPAVLAGNTVRTRALAQGELKRAYQEHRQGIDRVVALASGWSAVTERNAQRSVVSARTSLLLVGLLIVVASMLAAGWIARQITRPLEQGVKLMTELGQGHLGHRLHLGQKDEIGALTHAMDEFAEDLQNIVIGSMKKIAAGDLAIEVRPKDAGDEIAPALAGTIAALQGMNDEIMDLARAAMEGRLDARADTTKVGGDYRNMLEGINGTLDAVLQPIHEAAAVLERVANRDLSARVDGNYLGDHARIKDSLNRAVQNLDDSLQQVLVAVEQVASASSQVGGSSQDLARGASEQAAALEEVSSGLQEMTAVARQSAANAKEARGMAEGTRTGADRGLTSMQRMSEAMEKIKASSDSTAKIVKTIDEIAFQTNLLALNAAVEAARAGDAGKGFAVVAEEVRNLAMRSAEAAKNTANMIEESVHNAERGTTLNGEVLERLREIAAQAGRVSEVMGEIAVSSEQQTEGIDQISSAVEQMNQVTQQNAAGSEESASASEEMSAQAEELRALVSQFRLSAVQVAPVAKRATVAATGTDGRPAPARPGAARKPKLGLVHGGAASPESVIPFDDEGTLQSF